MSVKASHSPVRWMADLALSDRDSAGCKGATLGELQRLGIRVPAGFVVTTEAFEKNANDPGTVTDAITRAYRTLSMDSFRPDTPVAIRSSAADPGVPSETYLSVRGTNGVLHAVRSFSKAVLVQRMISSQSSGAIRTGDRSTVTIQGCWGIGIVMADTFIVNKASGEIVSRSVAEKLIQHVPDHFGGGVRQEPVPVDRQKAACLTDSQIAELANIAKRIERHLGAPQDIDWAIAPDERGAYILQSRANTVTGARPVLITLAAHTELRTTARVVPGIPRT